MSTIIPNIKTRNWQISTVGVGYIAEGLADIRQCLDLLLRTKKGSDPLRPEFGCDISEYIDRPLNYAIPNIIRAIIEAVEIWEKRVILRRVTYRIEGSKVRFFVTVALADEEIIDLILYYQNGGFIIGHEIDTGSLTLFALFPPNPNFKRYTISFKGDGELVLPIAPSIGFGSIQELYNWAKSNWSIYGSWQLGFDRITAFIPHGTFTSGSLTMGLTGVVKFKAPVPNMNLGESLSLAFVPNGVAASPVAPSSFQTIGEMLFWVQQNWGHYGTWQIEGNPYGPGDFDIQDFNAQDFDVGTPATYILALYTEIVESCVFEISIA